jgi:hypothetical protein
MTTPRYRAPAMIGAMLAALLGPEDIAAKVAASHETMRAEVERLITAQDRARRMILGVDEFTGIWRTERAPDDGGPVDVMGDAIASMAAYASPMTAFPGPAIHGFVRRLAEVDIQHPMVVHRELLRAACYSGDMPAPDWSDIDQFVGSQAVFGAGPQLGQECLFVASDESVHDGTVSHVWSPDLVNLDFQENGATRTAGSVKVVRQVEPGARYVCVLK